MRDLEGMGRWLRGAGLEGRCSLEPYADYGNQPHDAVINFVGVGDPRRAAEMGASIFQLTQDFDDLILRGLRAAPQRRYLFLSSGAAYGSAFLEPASSSTKASVNINALAPQEYYSVAKLHAEAKHRAEPGLAITDLRVFNYFSRTQDLAARFFITDILRAIRDKSVLRCSADFMVRDYLHPADFAQLAERLLDAPAQNGPVDCYTRAPVDKPALLEAMQKEFGLAYEMTEATVAPNATGAKPHYYSLDRKAAGFGYQPAYTSLEGILKEARAILEKA